MRRRLSNSFRVQSSYSYEGNELPLGSLSLRASARANAYLQSYSMRSGEIKVQDYLFQSDPTVSLQLQNQLPIFSFRSGTQDGEVVGSSIKVKEVYLKFMVYMNIPDAGEALEYPSDIPDFVVRYALVHSKQSYHGEDPVSPNFVSFQDVFNDVDSVTGEVISTPFSFKSLSNDERFVILRERSLHVGSFNPYLPSNSASFIIPPQNNPPFSQFFNDHVSLWDTNKNSNSDSGVESSSSGVLFSGGLNMTFDVSNLSESGAVYNEITSGSLWVVMAISPLFDQAIMARQPTIEYYTRVLYTDESGKDESIKN